jgi:hypothetical protein
MNTLNSFETNKTEKIYWGSQFVVLQLQSCVRGYECVKRTERKKAERKRAEREQNKLF